MLKLNSADNADGQPLALMCTLAVNNFIPSQTQQTHLDIKSVRSQASKHSHFTLTYTRVYIYINAHPCMHAYRNVP